MVPNEKKGKESIAAREFKQNRSSFGYHCLTVIKHYLSSLMLVNLPQTIQ